MFRLIGRLFAFLMTLVFVVMAFASVLGGMALSSTEVLLSGDYLAEIIAEKVPAGKVMNMIKGKDTYNEDASLAQIAVDKLDDATIQKYNLTEENMEQLLATDAFSAFISEKMDSAINAAADASVFEMNSAEVVDVLRSSEEEFVAITGVEMNEESYAEMEKAISDAGVKDIKHDFSAQNTAGTNNDSMEILKQIKALLTHKLDLIMYAAAGVCFLFILLFNLSKKRRVFFYSGLVILASGMIFTKLSDIDIMNVIPSLPEAAKPAIDMLTGAAATVGQDAVTIGAALFGLYVLCFVLSIVKKIFFRR